MKFDLFAGFAVACWLVCGCSHVSERTDAWHSASKQLMPWTKPTEKEVLDARPVKMVVIWTESVIYGPGHNPTRGLGGRIYVYNHRHQSIAVEDAELIVYAYDDTKGGHAAAAEPDRKYLITKEQFADHYSPSEFGPSYSVWIPWDKVGNQSTSLSVVPVLKMVNGQALVGDHSRALLPGKETHARCLKPTNAPALTVPIQQDDAFVMQTTHEQQPERSVDDRQSEGRSAMTSSTIRVSASMQKRLSQPKPNLPSVKGNESAAVITDGPVSSRANTDAKINSKETVSMRPRPSFQRLAGRSPIRSRVRASQSVPRPRDLILEPPVHEESPSGRSFQPSAVSRVLDARNSNDFLGWSGSSAAR